LALRSSAPTLATTKMSSDSLKRHHEPVTREKVDPHAAPSSPIDDDDNKDVNAQFGGLEARKALEKKLLRKVDLRMLILILVYMMNYLDRNNAAAARLRGFEEDLGLTGTNQFATLRACFSSSHCG